jgi:hypothetical protein
MPLSLVSLRTSLREHLGFEGDDEQSFPTDDTDEKIGTDTYLNRAYWELLDKFPFREKEVVASFNTTQGTNYYKVPSPFEAIRSLSIEDINSKQHTPLDLVSKDQFEQVYINDDSDEGVPEKYLREDLGIRLWPTPDATYRISIRYWTTLADLSDNNPASPIPQSWHEIILFGGVWRAFLGLNNDYSRAQAARAWQASLIDKLTPVESKEKQDASRAGLQVIGYGDRPL